MAEKFFLKLNYFIHRYMEWVHTKYELNTCGCYWCEQKAMIEDMNEWAEYGN